ncbi:hypothetical protein B0H17DRAFT_1136348 [Mycena rosella]|uniref:Uncharacterized protein n=1 Tax=Mycena rosella TaxID=1033263 RepID=A0AAD7DB46_MYCRO|nr:hypothetical protein B0H17DRAFT_1136348 [Mycena rosella]
MNIAYTRALERESAGLLKQMENESERNELAWYHRRARRKPETPSFGLRILGSPSMCHTPSPSCRRPQRCRLSANTCTNLSFGLGILGPSSTRRTPFASSPATLPTVDQYLHKQTPSFGLGVPINGSHPLRLLIVARNAADCRPIPVQTNSDLRTWGPPQRVAPPSPPHRRPQRH